MKLTTSGGQKTVLLYLEFLRGTDGKHSADTRGILILKFFRAISVLSLLEFSDGFSNYAELTGTDQKISLLFLIATLYYPKLQKIEHLTYGFARFYSYHCT